MIQPPRPRQIVRYYQPFTHFELADVVRVLTATAAVSVMAIVLLLAYRRWDEDRRSASLFLVALAAALAFESTATSLFTLGRPPTWWLIGGRIVVVALAAVGCRVVIGEARRGAWARRS